MPSLTERLAKRELIRIPIQVQNSIQYETIMGSESYGVASDGSDIDVYGWCIPSKEMIFPHLVGEIQGFGKQKQKFEQFQQHHIIDKEANKEYDISIYNIVKYFQLCMENNPNMIDSLFTPRRCVLHTTSIGEMVRENRKLFLHKGAWFKFKGYSFSQMHKMNIKNPEGKRKEMIDKYGYDVKFAYHVVRLLNEVEQILTEHDLDLERNREQLKSIRRGEWNIGQIQYYFNTKERELEKVYNESTLRHSPNEATIKTLLLNCLEEYYGSIDETIKLPNLGKQIIQDIMNLVDKYNKLV
jgi:uncharacterized protein